MKEQHGWSKPASGTNTATATKAAEAGRQHVVYRVDASVSGLLGAPGGLTVTIKDGSTTVWEVIADENTARLVGVHFPKGISITKGAACSVVATGSSGAVRVNLHGITRG